MRTTNPILAGCMLLVATCLFPTAEATLRTWDGGGGTSDWFTDANWSGDAKPVDGDDVEIAGGATVLLSADSPVLASATITNATLVFTNWSTTLTATNVYVRDSGVLGLPEGFTDVGPSNRIHLACSNLTVDAGGQLNADAAGFTASYGEGAGSANMTSGSRKRGGGYGGRGGIGSLEDDLGHTYGDVAAPLDPGSGGAGLTVGGTGGGAVWTQADGTVTINGTVSANGGNYTGNYGGGGSGGGVYIECDTIAGSGLVRVNGGNGYANLGGKAGGGRIAVSYNDAGASWPGLHVSASPGAVGYNAVKEYTGKPGTVWLSDTTILSEQMGGNLLTDAVVHFGSGSPWAPSMFSVSNNSFRIGNTGFVVNVSGNVRVDTGADFGVPNLNCGGSVLITNGGVLRIQSDPTNVVGGTYGGLLAVTSDIVVAPSSELWLQSHETDGGAPLVSVDNLTVAASGLVSGDGYGYKSIAGPGAGDNNQRCAGGGHGGKGGHGQYASSEGRPNGQAGPPIGPGSGGCLDERGGFGGGLVRIRAQGTVTVNGTVSSDGGRYGNGYGGGGSGGGVWIDCATFAGSSAGLIRANGNDGASNTGGGGGGGRIAVVYQNASPWPGVRFRCTPGTGYTGTIFPLLAEQGTVYLSDTSVLGPVVDGDQFTDVTLFVSGVTAWASDSLTVSSCSFRFGATDFLLTVTNDVVVDTAGYLGVVDLECGGDLVVTNGGALEAFANSTNGTGREFGAFLRVTNDIRVADSSWIYLRSYLKDGASPKIEAANVNVAANGGISADARGFEGTRGPGKGDDANRRRGGGYGGRGGKGDSGGGGAGGLTYGSTNAPAQPGSGGCHANAAGILNWGGFGGGLIFIGATGAVTVDGTLTANGGRYASGSYGGGGSGGGILVLCDTFSGGASGVVRANGGNGTSNTSGGGGGGRVSVGIGLSEAERTDLLAGNPVAGLTVFSTHSEFLGSLSATGGVGYTAGQPDSNGGEGSQVFLSTALALTVQGDPANYGSPLPDAYGTAADKSGGQWITNTVVTPADELAGQRWQCLGWELTNSAGTVISNGVSTQALFQVNENVFLTWFWTNEWLLTVSSGPNGTVNSNDVNGWHTNGVLVAGIDPVPTSGYFFAQWVGDIPPGQENDDPLTVAMDQARTLQASFASLSGETKYWGGSGTWETAGNWTPAGLPSPFDTAVITNGSVLFGVSRTVKSLVVSNGAEVVFTNWNTILTVSNDVVVEGTITLPGPFTESQESNRVQIVCSNLTVATGGLIDADGAGFAGQHGPGKGVTSTRGGGGGHGGDGGWGSTEGSKPGGTYDSTNAPAMPGSGGGEPLGGHGGGVIRVQATDSVTINGTVTADGAAGTGTGEPGGGSGGAIWITCDTFGGSSGVIRAGGGNAGNLAHGGGGGGGRIAVDYNALAVQRDVRFDLGSGNGWSEFYPETWGEERGAFDGTLHLPDAAYLVSPLTDDRFTDTVLHMDGVTSWSPASLAVGSCSVRFAGDDFTINVANDVQIGAGGVLDVSWLDCGGDLLLTNGGTLHLHAGPTNGTGLTHGGLLSVTGAIAVAPSSWLIVYAHPTDGGPTKIEAQTVRVDTNAGIRAHGRGYAAATGPGKGGNGASGRGGGAGYGGVGGIGSTSGANGGPTYGYTNAPAAPGSGGGQPDAGQGGGLVWINAAGIVTVDGTIDAKGRRGFGLGGGGSGGAIFIDCSSFDGGTDALLTTQGGEGDSTHGGGGGGGRIAVWWGMTALQRQALLADPDNPAVLPKLVTASTLETFLGTATATNGLAGYTPGVPGTVVFLTVPPPSGTLILVR